MEDCLGDVAGSEEGARGVTGEHGEALQMEVLGEPETGSWGPGKERSLSCGDLGEVPEGRELRSQRRGLGALDIHGEEIWKAGGHGEAWFQRVMGRGAGQP